MYRKDESRALNLCRDMIGETQWLYDVAQERWSVKADEESAVQMMGERLERVKKIVSTRTVFALCCLG